MTCQSCGAHNPEGARLCLACQRLLPAPGPDAPRCKTHPANTAAGPCGRCGTFYCGACLQGVGVQWLCEACRAVAGQLPWDNRETTGVLAGWFKTCTALMLNPIQALQTARPEDGIGSSLLFSGLSSVVMWAPTVVFYGLYFAALLPKFLGDKDTSKLAGPAFMGAAVAGYGVLLIGFTAVGPLIFGGLQHLVLAVTGGNPRPYPVTVRASALSLAPALVGLLPVCGVYVLVPWAVVLNVLALMALHKTDGWRAFFAAISPWLICCGCPFGLGVFSGLMRSVH